ncbi:MAG TPA: amidophosphoribosyltransferase [Rhabdochlamydiaceae bacterium]|nr:amidophosphoribosyltransferase [Rhabdochlamydiaceae bacterium]
MCGIFGIIGKERAAENLLQGLNLLQHRGQNGAGIFIYDASKKKSTLLKNRGLVHQVFSFQPLPEGSWGIGHLRYATAGKNSIQEVQPLVISKNKLTLSIVHNGNITNYISLKRELMAEGADFETTSDTEVILKILFSHLQEEMSFDSLSRAVEEVHSRVVGAYSILGIIEGFGLFAFRDSFGFRPFLYGTKQKGKAHFFSSEAGPLVQLDVQNICDVKPGQLLFIDQDYRLHQADLNEQKHSHCSFEFNYFCKPNAMIEGTDVYQIRFRLGQSLARNVKKAGFKIDVVIPIPDTARPSALGLARDLNIPLEEGFLKQDNVGRTFIMPTQDSRKKAVISKLSTVNSVFKDKKILLVDDSIVRGTVSKQAVYLARKAGAKKIFFASTYPQVLYPCYYGIDFPSQEELIAWGKSLEEISKALDIDGLVYNSVEDFKESVGLPDLCTACLTGNYPTCIQDANELTELRLVESRL